MRDLYDECSWRLEDVVTREAGRGERAPRDLTGDEEEVEEGEFVSESGARSGFGLLFLFFLSVADL